MSKTRKEITPEDFEACVEVAKSLGIDVVGYDNVWHTMFLRTDEWSLSLSVLKDLDEELQEKTDFYLFSTSISKMGSRTLDLCIGLKENR